jgi:hypothetical protein
MSTPYARSYTDHDCTRPVVGRQPKPKAPASQTFLDFNGKPQKPQCPLWLGYENGFFCQDV